MNTSAVKTDRTSVEQLVRDCDAWSRTFNEVTAHRDVLLALLAEREKAEAELAERNKGAWLDGLRYYCEICGMKGKL
jgi:hypothetical protein